MGKPKLALARAPRKVAGSTALVVGLGLSGEAVCRLLLAAGAGVVAVDSAKNPELAQRAEALEKLGAKVFLSCEAPRLLEGVNFLCVSPGVPPSNPMLRAAASRGVPAYSEIEVAWWGCPVPVVAVTGTNGKTTTTSLVAALLSAAGLSARAVGNIGVPLSAAVLEGGADALVCEVSSFQLERISLFTPEVVVVTNVTPDHLNRYDGDFNAYLAAKARVLENQDPASLAVLNADDPGTMALEPLVRGRLALFSRRGEVEQGAWVEDDWMRIRLGGREEEFLPLAKLRLPGAHNVENALAAAIAAAALADDWDGLRKGLAAFEPVEHRLESCGERDGVLFVNDSKATNVDSALKALESFPGRRLVLILGGRDKDMDFRPLAEPVRRCCRAVVTLGESAEKIEKTLGGAGGPVRVGSMEEAVALAAELARPGDVVLLSPSCASFDMFRNYEHRGRVFKELVSALVGRPA